MLHADMMHDMLHAAAAAACSRRASSIGIGITLTFTHAFRDGRAYYMLLKIVTCRCLLRLVRGKN